jgi:polysaccharide export outer membrane protein
VLQMLQQNRVYVKNPIINLRVMNFKVSVQGGGCSRVLYRRLRKDYTDWGLKQGGDLTIYGKGTIFWIIREIDGVKSYNRVDITNAVYQFPFIIWPKMTWSMERTKKTRINGAAIGPHGSHHFDNIDIITLITLIITTTK